jgi:DNA repair photolyase
MKIINETSGCSHRCIYCYANDPKTEPTLYDGLPDQLITKLNSSKSIPKRIYFSTTCDLFQPQAEVLSVTHRLLEIILSRGIGVAFLTKGVIPDVTIKLLSKYPKLVRAQIGINSPNDKLSLLIESGAATPEQRFRNVEKLIAAGIKTSIRMDPLIHGITDNIEDINIIFSRVSRYRLMSQGTETKVDLKSTERISECAISYLFLRPAVAKRMEKIIPSIRNGYTSESTLLGAGSKITVLDSKLRKQLYAAITDIALKYGIHTKICGCKNQDIFTSKDVPERGSDIFTSKDVPERNSDIFVAEENVCTKCHIAGEDICSSKVIDIEDLKSRNSAKSCCFKAKPMAIKLI